MPLSYPTDPGTGLPAVDIGVWHWTLSQSAQNPLGYVRSADLTKIGVLHGLTQNDLTHLTNSNIIG